MKIFNKGQITTVASILIAAMTMIGGVFTAKITADSAIKDKVSEINTATAVVARTVDLNEKNSTDRLNRLENKIDWLIQQQGGIPSLIADKNNK